MISETCSNIVSKEQKAEPESYALCLGEGLEFAEFTPAQWRLTVFHVLGVSRQVSLGYAEAYLLNYFVSHPGEMVSRQELLEHAWSDRVVSQGSLNQAISSLRSLLGDDHKREVILTVPRRGYQFNAEALVAWPVWLARKQQILSLSELSTETSTGPLAEIFDMPVTPASPVTPPPLVSGIYRLGMPMLWAIVGLLSLSLLIGFSALYFYKVFPPYASVQLDTAHTRLTLVAKTQDELVETRALLPSVLQRMDALGGGRVLINRAHNYLQFNCLRADGTLRRLLVHIKHLPSIEDSYLQGCLK
jgi:cholera toxin transcriptional activator